MRLRVPQGFRRVGTLGDLESVHVVQYVNDEGSRIELRFLSETLVRVVHQPPGVHGLVSSHTLDPGSNDNSEWNVAGISRKALGGSTQKGVVKETGPDVFETRQLRVEVKGLAEGDFRLVWTFLDGSSPQIPFLEDLPFRAYEYDIAEAGGAHHYVLQRDGDLHYGLGERASPLVLNERRFRLECCDALGYNAQKTDPLYKLIPYYLTLNTSSKHAYGLFYDTLCNGSMDLGCEKDALWGFYRNFKSQQKALDYNVFFGPSVKQCVQTFAALVGKPCLVPKYALGYLASSMGYAESENAQTLIEDFPQLCRKWDIPCDVLHLSSGYTVDPNTGCRNVFTWNKCVSFLCLD
jgi:alpha-glucosidase